VALDLLKQRGFDLIPARHHHADFERLSYPRDLFKADPKIRHLPVIMLTALDEVDSTVRCIEAGAEDYVPKPFNPVILYARINASLEKKRLRDQSRPTSPNCSGARQFRPPAAQRPAEGHRRPPETGRADDCR